MMIEQLEQGWYAKLISALRRAIRFSKLPRIHDFSQQPPNTFAFEQIDKNQSCMTGQGRDLRCGDYILLSFGQQLRPYQIQDIDYYSSPSDTWIALLLEADLSEQVAKRRKAGKAAAETKIAF
jgi:hypothetical protein